MKIFLDSTTDHFRLVYRPEAEMQGMDEEHESSEAPALTDVSSPDRLSTVGGESAAAVLEPVKLSELRHPKYPDNVWED